MTEFKFVSFNDLSLEQLYEILALRESVFTFEQKCNEPDLDGLDKKAVHLVGYQRKKLVTCARILPADAFEKESISFGRLVVHSDHRGTGLGKVAMEKIVQYILRNYPNTPIKCSAQHYLQSFYESLGFQVEGEPYDEGGIPHVTMVR